MELVLQRFLAPVYCLKVPRLGCSQKRRGPGSGLLPQSSQTQTRRGSRVLPIAFDVPDQYPDPQRSWLGLLPMRSQTHAWPQEISGSCQLTWRSQIHAQTGRDPGSDLDSDIETASSAQDSGCCWRMSRAIGASLSGLCCFRKGQVHKPGLLQNKSGSIEAGGGAQ